MAHHSDLCKMKLKLCIDLKFKIGVERYFPAVIQVETFSASSTGTTIIGHILNLAPPPLELPDQRDRLLDH